MVTTLEDPKRSLITIRGISSFIRRVEKLLEPAEFIEDFYQEISEERAEIMEKFSTNGGGIKG